MDSNPAPRPLRLCLRPHPLSKPGVSRDPTDVHAGRAAASCLCPLLALPAEGSREQRGPGLRPWSEHSRASRAPHKAGAEPADRRLEQGSAWIRVTQQAGERVASGLTSSLTSGLPVPAAAGVQGRVDVSGLWAKAPRVVNAGPIQPPLLVASLCSGKKVDDSSRLMSAPVERASLASGSQKLQSTGTA